jgi:hypothetical protein
VVCVAALGCGGLVLASCQDTIKTGIKNSCGSPFEFAVDDVADPVSLGYSLHWVALAPGETNGGISAGEGVRALFLRVRRIGSDSSPQPVEYPVASLPHATGLDALIDVVGSACPI